MLFQKSFWLNLVLLVGFSFSCPASISIEDAIRIAKPYVGEVIHSSKGQSKKTGECYYRVRGTEGTALIDAKDGKLIRFYRSR
ncbi:MAG: PepSY domain-containing protein [Hydrogenobacter sp.]|uniref:Peptidase propeptide and YPEB domain-containing protein n=1 Tax=Hydrogenobacter hydrogenophilus TaxID=35835 RepID=A0A285P2Y8_9AQUI|nr:PepSY domain-containing protein [Hydrogenobacter hydrogenophilus]SNZ16095.1 hypothetical protein SAMN06265353_1519 [Hydrogenobacter hydrogenophilus]